MLLKMHDTLIIFNYGNLKITYALKIIRYIYLDFISVTQTMTLQGTCGTVKSCELGV